jgi:7SK snRNA methylphosphate capping enzyme
MSNILVIILCMANILIPIKVQSDEVQKPEEMEGANLVLVESTSIDTSFDERINPGEIQSTQNESVIKENKMESPQKDKNKLRLKGLDEIKDKRLRKVDVKDRIVSPVIPQPGAWKLRPQHRPNQDKKKKHHMMRNFRPKDARYQYGNYNRYYGYRNPHHEIDPRLKVFTQRKELFMRKDILDIGCNVGHVTLSVARDFGAKSITGIDIDRILINIARKNVKHYVNCVQSPASNEDNEKRDSSDVNFFPMSMPINYGPVDIPGFLKNKQHKGFPYNVTFVQVIRV